MSKTTFTFTNKDGKTGSFDVICFLHREWIVNIKCASCLTFELVNEHREEILERCNAETIRLHNYAPKELQTFVVPPFWLKGKSFFLFGIMNVDVKIAYASCEDHLTDILGADLAYDVELNTRLNPTFEDIASSVQIGPSFFSEKTYKTALKFETGEYKIGQFYQKKLPYSSSKGYTFFSLDKHILEQTREDLNIECSLVLTARAYPASLLEEYYGFVM